MLRKPRLRISQGRRSHPFGNWDFPRVILWRFWRRPTDLSPRFTLWVNKTYTFGAYSWSQACGLIGRGIVCDWGCKFHAREGSSRGALDPMMGRLGRTRTPRGQALYPTVSTISLICFGALLLLAVLSVLSGRLLDVEDSRSHSESRSAQSFQFEDEDDSLVCMWCSSPFHMYCWQEFFSETPMWLSMTSSVVSIIGVR